MSTIEEKTDQLVLFLLGHEEKKLRAAYLEEKLKPLAVEEIAAILNLIGTRASGKKISYLKAYNALPELLRSQNLSRDKVQQLRSVARQNDDVEVLQMFFNLPPKEVPYSAEQLLSQDPFLKDLTLGARISLAKTHSKETLKKLLKVQDPAVIRTLLLNPRLTEVDVLKIASLQPTSPRVLEEVFRNPKWSARYRVKKALIYNTFCPPSIALYLLKFMVIGDLSEIALSEKLHQAIQEAAHQLIHSLRKQRGF